MDSNTLGEVAKRIVELDLLKKGFKVARVLGAMNKYDLLILKDKVWKRVKVKTVQRWGEKPDQKSKRKIDEREVDIYATVDMLPGKPIIEYIKIRKWQIEIETNLDKKHPKEPPEIWCGDCGNLYRDTYIQDQFTLFRCRYPGYEVYFGMGGRFLSKDRPPKPAPEWCPRWKHNDK